jgi:hypothetical protein
MRRAGEADMKVWAAVALVLALSAPAAHADDLQKAFDAVSLSLKKDGGGLAPSYDACPKKDPDDNWEYAGSSVVVFINQSDRAILVNAGFCNGGNGSAQHLVIIQNGTADLISDVGLQDMSFLADHMYLDGGSIVLYGSRWLKNDPHCCPSRKATLEYNLKTHQQKMTLLPKGAS